MEIRKQAISGMKMCRFCLTQDGKLSSIYDRSRAPKNITLPMQILSCISVEVFPSDRMPNQICERCRFFMDICYQFKQICRQSDESILTFVDNGEGLETVSYSSNLVKLFRYANHSNKGDLGTVMTESGACVQVSTSVEHSDTEDEDENVYNIKIDTDGSEQVTKGSACIKVVTGGDKLHITKEDEKTGSKGFTTGPKLAKHVRTHVGGRPYPCKYCDKTFLKSHHYTRHLRVKHGDLTGTSQTAFSGNEQYRCDQCEDSFETQDELIYHSAIHATQNLICPLCQEKFENVDAVTAHIKTHQGPQFMCDLCELVFTSKEKLDLHLTLKHMDELNQEQLDDSMEAEEEDDDDNDISVKEEGDSMVVEIKKHNEYVLQSSADSADEEKIISSMKDNEMVNLSPIEKTALANQKAIQQTTPKAIITKTVTLSPNKKLILPSKAGGKDSGSKVQLVSTVIIKKSDELKPLAVMKTPNELKRKAPQVESSVNDKSSERIENSSVGASDKSLRLLEKELQELKRTSSRGDPNKSATKLADVKLRRSHINTSTPKSSRGEEKKQIVLPKVASVEKKIPDRRNVITKENKEPRENKETKGNSNSSHKEEKKKDEESKDVKEHKVVAKNIKNGSSERKSMEDSIRRSSRPSKIKDYAKMIRESSHVSSEDDDSDDDEEYTHVETPKVENRGRPKKNQPKPTPKPVPVADPAKTPRKRGRPRKDKVEIPNKVKKTNSTDKVEQEESISKMKEQDQNTDDNKSMELESKGDEESSNSPKTPEDSSSAGNSSSPVLTSPSGQSLKKVPIKALPPGIKPLPLPSPRTMAGSELCEMQIGKKVVKVQKIVMTKAEVEAMAKKGLLEMKDGTMVLKQGFKLPQAADPMAIKTTLVGDGNKEALTKKDKGAPTRCDIEED